MNPLAVLRWRHRTEEQVEAKRVWEDGLKKSTSNGWNGGLHASPGSIESSAKLGSRASEDLKRSSKPLSDLTRSSGDSTKGWTYTIGDITAYNDAEGVVNYFIPPRPAFAPETQNLSDAANQASKKGDADSSAATSEKKDEHPAKDRITSASVVSLVDGDNASVKSPNVSMVSLSRTASLEKGGRSRHREHSVSHLVTPRRQNSETDAI
jgi:hypothetical protein